MIRTCLFMLAGGLAAQHSRVPLSSDLCNLIMVASIALLLLRRSRYLGCATLGFALFLFAGQNVVDNRLDPKYAGDSLLTDVRVLDFPRMSHKSLVMLVEPVNDPRLPGRSRVSWFEPPRQPQLGEVWRLELRLRRPRSLSNPGVFDGEAWMFRNKIHATGYVVPGPRNQLLEAGAESALDRFRRQFVGRAASASASAQVSGVIAAVGVGARHQISREQWQRYALSGTSHLMAISGLHIGLAGTAAFLLVRLFACLLRPRGNMHITALVTGVMAALAYAAVSGLGIPAQRAACMLTVAAYAIGRRRKADPFIILAIAALAVFILDPVATMAPGFQLSFSAVLLLLWLARRKTATAEAGHTVVKIGRFFRQLFVIQVNLLFGLMPLFSLLIVPAVLAGLALGDLFAKAGIAALGAAAISIEWLEMLITGALRLPFANTPVAALENAWRLLAIIPALFVLLPKGWPGRYAGVVAVAALLLHSPRPPDEGCMDVYVLDVGQGLSTVLQTHTRTLVFDTGAAYRGGASVAEQVILPFLKSRAISRIDWLVVSHADMDHSGGAAPIVAGVEVGDILVGEALRHHEPLASPCLAGQRWAADGVEFRVLHPDSDARWRGNNASCVLLVRVGAHGLLLTGDIEAAAEQEILQTSVLSRIDAVLVPHHGSLTSSSTRLVNTVAPDLAIVSAGHGNRWGFPKATVAARWRAVGARLYSTATSGAVSVRLCADRGISRVRTDRHERRRFWRSGSD